MEILEESVCERELFKRVIDLEGLDSLKGQNPYICDPCDGCSQSCGGCSSQDYSNQNEII
jgi:hypothetical protein